MHNELATSSCLTLTSVLPSDLKTGNVCYDWQKGMCNRLNCRFVHSADGASEDGFAPQQTMGICFDWQKGLCERAQCR